MEVAPRTAASPAAQQPNATPVYKYIRAEATNTKFLAKLAKARKLAGNQSATKSAAVKIQESEKAQTTPRAESQALSNQGQVTNLQAQPVAKPSEAEAKQALQNSISQSVPTSLEGISGFKNSGKGKQIGEAVMQKVGGDVAAVKTGFGSIGTPGAPAPAAPPAVLPPMEQALPTEQINPGEGMLPPVEAKMIDNTEYLKKSDDTLKKEEISQEQLDMVDSGDLAKANKERQNLNKEAVAQPLAVQQRAAAEQKSMDTELHAEEKNARADMNRHRQKNLNETGTKQDKAKLELEKKREEVAQNINSRYEKCQRSITAKLDALEKNSLVQFDAGQAKATKDFEDQVNTDINKFKSKRYDRFGGGLLWLKDKLCGIDDFPEVKQAFDRARAVFVKNIDTLIAHITRTNNEVIAACKKELEDTKAEIAKYVASLGPQLRDIGKKAMDDVNRKLEALSAEVDRRKEKLQEKLADKRKAAMEAIDKKIEAMKASMSGLLSIIGNLLLMAAKKFFKWALEAAGISPDRVMGIIDKGVAIIKAIVTKPIVFVKNLINAAKTGFRNFGNNFLKHLKDAIFNWLTGALEGVSLPKVWDMKGIFMLVLDILGLTYQAIRKRMVDLLGEPVVANLEKVFTLVKTLVTQGPMAAWEQLKDMAGEIKDAFVDGIKSWIQNTIIYKAIETVISIFIPGAGIVKAIIAIYDTVMFFIQKAKEIAQMIGSFLGSIGEIAMGNIGAAADALESGLAKALSLVINFLARFLHLSGITDKIKKVIETIRAKVGMILDKIVAWIQKMAGKLLGKKDGKDDKVSSNVIQQVQQHLKNKSRDLDSAASFKNIVNEIASITPGLTAIRVRRVNEGSYVIEASASPYTFVGVVNNMVKSDYGYVVGTVAFDGQLFGQPAYNGEGHHAEDKIIGFIRTQFQYLQRRGAPLPNKVEIYVSQSPCKNRCTPNLIQLKNQFPAINSWTVYYSYEYAGTSGKHAKDSMEARELLKKDGFHVLQFDQALEMEKKGKAP